MAVPPDRLLLDTEASLGQWKLGFVHGTQGVCDDEAVAELGGERLESRGSCGISAFGAAGCLRGWLWWVVG